MPMLRTELTGGVAVTSAGTADVSVSAAPAETTPAVPPGSISYPPNGQAAFPGRLPGRRFARGVATGPAAGNTVVTSDARGDTATYPGRGGGDSGDTNQGAQQSQQRYVSNRKAFPSIARTPATQNNKLVARDRHILENQGRTVTSPRHADPGSGIPNPEADGPPRPAANMIDRTLSWQIGTDATRYLDNAGYHATTTAGGRTIPLATQGDPWTEINGGTPGLYRPYGSRGGQGLEGPAPTIRALPGDGSGMRPGTIIQQGAPGDGVQKIYGGTPHGLHSPTVPAPVVTQAGYRNRANITPPRRYLAANSKIAGQSWSQLTARLDSTAASPVPTAPGGRQPGVNGRFRGAT